jgi:hypothetical protein
VQKNNIAGYNGTDWRICEYKIRVPCGLTPFTFDGMKKKICNNNNNNNNWSHWNSNEKLKEKFGSCTRKTFGRFTTKDSYTWNITH